MGKQKNMTATTAKIFQYKYAKAFLVLATLLFLTQFASLTCGILRTTVLDKYNENGELEQRIIGLHDYHKANTADSHIQVQAILNTLKKHVIDTQFLLEISSPEIVKLLSYLTNNTDWALLEQQYPPHMVNNHKNMFQDRSLAYIFDQIAKNFLNHYYPLDNIRPIIQHLISSISLNLNHAKTSSSRQDSLTIPQTLQELNQFVSPYLLRIIQKAERLLKNLSNPQNKDFVIKFLETFQHYKRSWQNIFTGIPNEKRLVPRPHEMNMIMSWIANTKGNPYYTEVVTINALDQILQTSAASHLSVVAGMQHAEHINAILQRENLGYTITYDSKVTLADNSKYIYKNGFECDLLRHWYVQWFYSSSLISRLYDVLFTDKGKKHYQHVNCLQTQEEKRFSEAQMITAEELEKTFLAPVSPPLQHKDEL